MLTFTDTEKNALINKLTKILEFVNYGAGVDAYFGNGTNEDDSFELLLDPDEPDNDALISVLAKLKGSHPPEPLQNILVPTEFVKGLYNTFVMLETYMDEKDLGPIKYDEISQQLSSLNVGLQNENINPDTGEAIE